MPCSPQQCIPCAEIWGGRHIPCWTAESACLLPAMTSGPQAPRADLPQELASRVAPDVGVPVLAGPWPGTGAGGLGGRADGPAALPQVIQQPPKPGALIRPPQVTLTQTPMVALRQPHSRIVLTAPQQIQLNQLQPGEGPRLGPLPARGALCGHRLLASVGQGVQSQTRLALLVSVPSLSCT